MSEYNIQMNKYNALNAEYDQLYPQPMKHASTHAKDGSDPITPSSIGAAELGADGKVLTSQLPSIEVDAYTKVQTLSDTTKTLYGLDATAVPDDVLSLIKTLIDNANASISTKAKIQTGSYVGTGTYGASNPCSLTFDFIPMMLIITMNNCSLRPNNNEAWHFCALIFNNPITHRQICYPDGEDVLKTTVFDFDVNTIKWYSDNRAEGQLNKNNQTYTYICFG